MLTIQVEVVKADGTKETITVELSYSDLGAYANGNGWAAALNGFDIGCTQGHGRNAADAVYDLCDMIDVTPSQPLPEYM